MTLEKRADAIVESLASAVLNGRLCLILGAGASQDLDLPSWTNWVRRFARYVAPRGAGMHDIYDPAWALECVRGDLPESRYRLWLRDSLYGESFSLSSEQRRFSACGRLARLAIRIANQMYKESGERASGPWSGGQVGEFHAVSYNLDCILEKCIAAEGYSVDAYIPLIAGDRPFHIYSFDPEDGRRQNQPPVRVLHPHGLLPLSDQAYADERLLRQLPLVMASVDYESIGGTADVWQNSLQVGAFVHRPCLFYGLSFADPSIRQLLRLSTVLKGDAVDRMHTTFLARPGADAIPSPQETESAMARLGFGALYWSARESGFEDQLVMLERVLEATEIELNSREGSPRSM